MTETLVACLECNRELKEDAVFCDKCGKKRAFCQKCQVPIARKTKSCSACGEKQVRQLVFHD